MIKDIIRGIRYYFSVGNFLKIFLKLNKSDDSKLKPIKKRKVSPLGEKLLAASKRVEIRKGLDLKNSSDENLFKELQDLYFNNFEEGKSRFLRDYTPKLLERALTHPDYLIFIYLNDDHKPIAFLMMTDNSELLKDDIWLDPIYFEDKIKNKEKLKKYWVSQVCVQSDKKRNKIFSALITKVILFCQKNKVMVFFDWSVETSFFIPTLIKSIGREIGIPIKSKHLSCQICSAFWESEY